MAREVINVGAAPNDGTGDPIRTAYIKCNNNFGELYSRAQENPPNTLIGTVGDQAGMYAYSANYFYYCYQDYDGSSVIWAEIPNSVADANEIANGTTRVSIPTANSNVNINVAGVTNVAVFASSGAVINGNVTTSGLLNATGNVTGGNIITTGVITTTGNVSAGNIAIGGSGFINGDFSSAVGSGRTVFQTSITSNNSATFLTAIPHPNNTDTFGASLTAYATANGAIPSGFALQAGNAEHRLLSFASGSAVYKPITIWNSNAEQVRIDINGNVGIGNTVPVDNLSVSGTAYFSGNITANQSITANGTITGNVMLSTTYIKTTAVVVANLPAAATAGAGARAFVTDATDITFASNVAGGGGNSVPVFSDGSVWKIG